MTLGITTTIGWKPIAKAPKDGTAFLAFIPNTASSLQCRGLHALHWSGWGGGIWETAGGQRFTDSDVIGAVWIPLEPLANSAREAAEAANDVAPSQ